MVFGGYKDNKPIDIPATNGTISLLAIIKWNALPPFVLDSQKEYDIKWPGENTNKKRQLAQARQDFGGWMKRRLLAKCSKDHDNM